MTHSIGIIENAHERKEVEQRLRETILELEKSREMYRILTELSPDGICVHSQGKIVFANNAAAKILRARTPEELIGKSVWDIIHPDFHSCVLERMNMKPSDIAPMKDLVYIRLDGSLVDVAVTGSRITYQGQTAIEVVIRDNSERKQHEQELKLLMDQLKEAIRARDTFIGIASHELRTPLTTLKLNNILSKRLLETREHSFCEPREIEKFIKTASVQVDRLIRLVNDMFDVTCIDSGQMTMHREAVDLGQLVHDVVDRFAEQVGKEGFRYRLTTESSIKGTWDRPRMEQVMMNLLSNAVKYGAGKPIEISVAAERDKAFLSVRDFGMGIAKERQAIIFQRFERDVSPNHIGGLGLGLYIALQIVKSHQGEIRVDSDLGKGSTFTVEIPIEDRPKEG